MKKNLILLLFSALSFNLLAQTAQKGPLDGKTFIIEMFKNGKKKPMEPDEFKFTSGKFKSKFFGEQWGFKQGPYKINSIDSTNATAKIYSWTAETVSDIKEVTTWKGTINGEDLEGTSEMVDEKGKSEYTFTFTGKLKGKPGKK